MYKISLIVPVYNTEKYIENCLDSLINQTYNNIEIICVNDGSTDNSLNILKDYEKKDNRIIVIDKKNEGVSVARNIGIEKATGDYFMVVDSDDTIELNTCEILMNNLNNNSSVDIIYFQRFNIDKKGKHKCNGGKLSKYYLELKDKPIKFFDKQNEIFDTLYLGQTYICKRNFVISNNIKYPLGINTGEDHIFHIRLLKLNPIIMIIDEYLYNYYDRENSLSKVGALKYCKSYKYEHIDKFMVEMFSKTKNLSLNDIIFKKLVYNHYLNLLLGLWIDIYFTKNKRIYISLLDETVSGNSKLSISKNDVKKMLGYNLYLKFRILSTLHLGYVYVKIFRPAISKINEMVINNAK